MSAFKSIILVLAVVAVAAPLAQGRRLLKERDWNAINGDSGDSTGTEVLSRARVFEGGAGTPRRAVTPEAAEATANPGFLGIWRREMSDKNSVPFATVESDPLFVNPDRKKGTIMPRARSAQDVPDLAHRPNLVSGNAQVPVVAMGSAAVANTFEGALSAATSDSITINGRNMPSRKDTTVAKSMLTSDTGYVPKASKAASYGTTAQNADSVALAGPADGKLVVAQANEIASVAQSSISNADSWQATNYGTIGKKSRD